MVAYSGARHFPLSADYDQIIQSEEGVRWLSAGNAVKFMQMMSDIDRKIRPQLHRELLAACEGAQAIISNLVIESSVAAIAEKLKLPLMLGYTIPLVPTAEIPNAVFAAWAPPLRLANRLSHALFETVFWQTQKSIINGWRAELGLPAASEAPRAKLWRAGTPVLHAYSSHLVPRPPEWGASHISTGFWRLPPEIAVQAGGAPTPELTRWLAEGPPPVYLGYWRLPVLDKVGMLRLAIDVASAVGVRFVIGANWSAQELAGVTLPKSVFITPSVDHDWLFARCAATVHHGGAGTTAATLRAGLPMVIFPIFADQPFWGQRVTALGVGCSMQFKALNVPRLARALRQIQDGAIRARAAALSVELRREDGLATAVRVIEERLPTAPIPG